MNLLSYGLENLNDGEQSEPEHECEGCHNTEEESELFWDPHMDAYYCQRCKDAANVNEDGAAASGAASSIGPGGTGVSSMSTATPAPNGATTTDNIKYLPSGFLRIKNKLKDMAKKKNNWKVEVKESESDYNVNFENELNVVVPKVYWDDFKSNTHLTMKDGKFIVESRNRIDENQVNLSWLIREETPTVLKEGLKGIEAELKSLLVLKGLPIMEKQAMEWNRVFGSLACMKHDNALLEINDFYLGVKKFIKLVEKEYEDDLGGLQIFERQLSEGDLGVIPFFKKYPYLISERIYSKVGKIGLVYEVLFTRDFKLSESVITDHGMVLLESSGNLNFMYQGKMIMPRHGLFNPVGLHELRNIIENLEENK